MTKKNMTSQGYIQENFNFKATIQYPTIRNEVLPDHVATHQNICPQQSRMNYLTLRQTKF